MIALRIEALTSLAAAPALFAGLALDLQVAGLAVEHLFSSSHILGLPVRISFPQIMRLLVRIDRAWVLIGELLCWLLGQSFSVQRIAKVVPVLNK